MLVWLRKASSDEEVDTPEVISGRKKILVSEEAIRLMPKFLPSTKMKYMMEVLMKGIEKRSEKTLIILQRTGSLSLVSDYLTEKGVIQVN